MVLLESPFPDETSGDPGAEFHKIAAPSIIPPDELAKQLSPEKVKALQALNAGQNMRQAAKSSGVGRTTLYRWLKHDPYFRAAFNAWKEEMLESAHARLLRSADIAITTLVQAIAKGDARSALAMLKGIGALAPQRGGLTDPAMLNRQMELDRRHQRVELAERSQKLAEEESRCLRKLSDKARLEEYTRTRRDRELRDAQQAAVQGDGTKDKPR